MKSESEIRKGLDRVNKQLEEQKIQLKRMDKTSPGYNTVECNIRMMGAAKRQLEWVLNF